MPKFTTMTISLPAKTVAAVRRTAKRQDRSISGMVRWMIETYYASVRTKPKKK